MSKVLIDKARCKACKTCVRACPKKALSLGSQINKKGYQIVEIDETQCIQCGICYYVCPDCVFELEE